jgi:predicted lipoprotein with Yx(FWY)xxD motif
MRARFVFLGTVLTVGLAACGGGGTDHPQHSTASTASGDSAASVKISRSSLGPILTDQSGRTLYAFARDKNGGSSCAGNCIATWPALTSRGKVVATAGANGSLLGGTRRAEGTTQATYGDWPLYYYAGDMSAGDVDGQGVDGVWFAVGANGKLVKTGR